MKWWQLSSQLQGETKSEVEDTLQVKPLVWKMIEN